MDMDSAVAVGVDTVDMANNKLAKNELMVLIIKIQSSTAR